MSTPAEVSLEKHLFSLETLLLSALGVNSINDPTTYDHCHDCHSDTLWNTVKTIINNIRSISLILQEHQNILISVKNQKNIRLCFELITLTGIAPCLIPGIGINIDKKYKDTSLKPDLNGDEDEKYSRITICTNFYTECYGIPVLKNIILTFHFNDYLAALIQLCFAPIKKPGTYEKYVMTETMYTKLMQERKKYLMTYENLVSNCFQPILMKELLILHSATEPRPPIFVQKVVAKEMSRRLLVPGGLLCLMRCFFESYTKDSGFDWKKVDAICKIIVKKHGNTTLNEYLKNISTQILEILHLKNSHYLASASACIFTLYNNYPNDINVATLTKKLFNCFDLEEVKSKCTLPGTLVLTPEEVEQQIHVLYSCFCCGRVGFPLDFLSRNAYILFIICIKCNKNKGLRLKLNELLLIYLESLKEPENESVMIEFLFGKNPSIHDLNLSVDESDAGLILKCTTTQFIHPIDEATEMILHLLKTSNCEKYIHDTFQICLNILVSITKGSFKLQSRDQGLYTEHEDKTFFTLANAIVLQILGELSTSPKIINFVKNNPLNIVEFIENIIQDAQASEENISVCLVLLNTILSEKVDEKQVKSRLSNLVPTLQNLKSRNHNSYIQILCNEILRFLSGESAFEKKSNYEKAIKDVFDDLLPVRAHGIIELTKLLNKKDPETLSKKHLLLCLLQDQLQNEDSYLYLAAINGLAALATHCTEDVLQTLCSEFLGTTSEEIETDSSYSESLKKRMKVGDIIVKTVNNLGEMAVVHKTLLLNTILCACRDPDALIRTSALSNLAEIVRVLNYRIGTILYEVLLCIWSAIETDKAPECRRAAVMAIASLIKGLGKETLTELKEQLLPIYRTLKGLYNNENEDSVVRLHAQLALEELNSVVEEFLLPNLELEKKLYIL